MAEISVDLERLENGEQTDTWRMLEDWLPRQDNKMIYY